MNKIGMNKRVLILFIGFAIIATVLILNSTVFTIASVEVSFDNKLSDENGQALTNDIIEASGIKVGKNVFTLSESAVVKNIQSKIPNVRVINIERRFPNKVIIHASKRIPSLAIPFKQSHTNKTFYAIVDSEMYVLSIADIINSKEYTLVNGFLLSGNYEIIIGEQLTASFGDEVFYLQNIAVSFEQAGLLPEEFVAFISQINFLNLNEIKVDIITNSGVTIQIDSLNTSEISLLVKKAYEWYNQFSESDEQVLSGYAFYDFEQSKYVWYSNR